MVNIEYSQRKPDFKTSCQEGEEGKEAQEGWWSEIRGTQRFNISK